jgi:hypothetical protein
MIDIKNVLEVINEVLVLPIVIITFFLLIYIAAYLRKKDPDVIRSRIFLKYNEIKKAFLLFIAFAFILILHVSLIYIPHFFSWDHIPFIDDLQRIFGLVLVIILIAFVFIIYISLKDSISPL